MNPVGERPRQRRPLAHLRARLRGGAPLWAVAPDLLYVTQRWGCTDYNGEWSAPWCQYGYYHAGIDIASATCCGVPVYATRSGVVAQVGTFDFGGSSYYGGWLGPNSVCLKYDDGIYVWHGHLTDNTVSTGQRVSPGTLIGHVGTQGASNGCHLHVEAREDGPYQGVANNAANLRDPGPYLNPPPVPVPAPTTIPIPTLLEAMS